MPNTSKNKEICMKVVSFNKKGLKYVPPEVIDKEICEMAVNVYGEMLRYVPDQLRNIDMCVLAVKNSANALQYVPESINNKYFYIQLINSGSYPNILSDIPSHIID